MPRHVTLIARWLVLSLAGYLVYALGRAFIGILSLGFPWYDWQWYLPVIGLVLLPTIFAVWRFPAPKPFFTSIAILLTWLLAGYNGFGQTIRLDASNATPTPISFWSNIEITDASDELLNDIHDAGGYLYINVDTGLLFGDGQQRLVNGLKRLAGHGIQVYLNILASDYLSVPVAEEWINRARQTAEIVRRENLENVRGLLGDAEAPYQYPKDYWNTDSRAFETTVARMGRFLGEARVRNPDLQIGVTASGPQFLDGLDSDTDLARILRSPVDPPGGWAFLNMMTYSSYLPDEWQPYFMYVSEYGLMRRYPGQRLSYLIGLVGSPSEPEHNFDELVRDARISRALGAKEIVIFRLDGALKEYGDDFVRELTKQVKGNEVRAPIEITFSRPVSLLVYGLLLGDALLDIRGSRVLLLVGWMVVSGLLIRWGPRQTH